MIVATDKAFIQIWRNCKNSV